MGKKLDSTLIKMQREKRGWSQEQLAEVSGLGLRTIQRIESEGRSSLESARALASVFEMPLDGLWLKEPEIFYDHYQTSYAAFTTSILVFAAGLTATNLAEPLAKDITLVSVVTMLIVLLTTFIFSTLRIRLSQNNLIWSFGLGLFKGSIQLSEIQEVKWVRNKWWYGLGIRILPHCILYNIWGLDAVEITRANGRRTRLGTDEPEELVQSILSVIKS
jgi:transcriptional regulator with XRE-family HTH domain